MNNVLLFIGAVLVVALAALFAVPHFVDWNVYRGGFETQASKLIGREIRVGGRVSMRLLPAPYVSFENVRVADAEGRFSEPPLRVDAFTLWLSIPPLLRGAVEASEVDLRRPEFLVRLQDTADGKAAGAPSPVAVLPVSIALRSVSVHDGTVRFVNSAGVETLKLDKANGEFSAPALEGPFRFRGTLQHGGRDREVRLTTGRIEPDGGLTVDATVRVAEQASAYQFKGRLSEPATAPVFTGDLTVKPTAERAAKARQTGQAGQTQPAARDDLPPFYEIKSRLRLSMAAAQLDDLAVLFEQAGRPQMLSGSASAVFGTSGGGAGGAAGEDTRVTAALDARWLDLDQIGGGSSDRPGDRPGDKAADKPAGKTGDKSGPSTPLTGLGALAQSWLPAGVTANVRIGIEQATLGADTVHGVELIIAQNKDVVQVQRFAANLPGGGRLETSGFLKGHRGASLEAGVYQGSIQIRGQSLSRFLAWAMPGQAPRLDDGTGAFGLTGGLTITKERIGLVQMRGEIAATTFLGEAGVLRGDQPELTLSIESDRLDLRPFMTGGLKLADIGRALLGPAATAPSVAPAQTPAKPGRIEPTVADRYAALNSDVRLKVGRLILPEVELRDVVGDVRRNERGTSIRALKFATASGLKVQADGQLQLADGRQRGALMALIEVEQPAALGMLLRFVDLPEAQVLEARGPDLLPLRLAGILTLGARGGTGFELSLDGAAQETRTSVVARSDQEPAAWRSGVLDLTATLENGKSSRLLAQLLPGTTALSLGAAEKARLSLRANGVAQTGLSTAIELESKAVEAGFSGLITLPGAQANLRGEIGLKSADVADSLRLAGLKTVRALQGRDLVLHARIATSGDEIQVTEAALRLGSASVEAQGSILRQAGRLEVDLKAKANEASLPAILAIALGTNAGLSGTPAQGRGQGNQGGQGNNVWPEDAFDLSALGDVGGKIRLEAGTLSLGQGLEVQRAVVEAQVSPTSVEVRSVTGETLGGRFAGNARAEKTAAGVSLQGMAKFDDLKLDRINSAEGVPPAVKGTAAATMTFNGHGLTPRGLVASLAGQGTLHLKDVKISRYGPEALDAVLAQALAPVPDDKEPVEVKLEPGVFKPLIVAELAKIPLVLGSRILALDIADGAIRTKSIAIDVPRGRIKGTSYLDLTSVRIDSEWSIETLSRFEARASRPADATTKAGGPPRTEGSTTLTAATVPGVNLVLTGPLSEIAWLEPRLNTEALARELLVRRMEKDLEALERARKKKEDAEALLVKQKEDAERLKEEQRRLADEQRQKNEQRHKDEQAAAEALDRAKATAGPDLSQPAKPTVLPSPAAAVVAPVPTPILVAPPVPALQAKPQSAAEPITPPPPTTSSLTPANSGEAKPADPAATPPDPRASGAARQRSESSSRPPPPKVNRTPGVFDPSRGL